MERMNKEELKKELKKLKDFKVYAFEGDVYVKAEDYKKIAIENKKLRAYADNLDSENDNQAIEIEELKKENKKLKKYYDRDKEELMESCYGLARENDKLKSDLMEDMKEITKLEKENKNLTKCNLNLQEWIDNKEKVNKSLREELSAYDREYFDEDKKAKNIFIDKSGKVIKGGEFTTLC